MLKKVLSAKLAGDILLSLLILLSLFHLLVIFGAVPPDMVWGGQVADAPGNRVLYELIALAVVLIYMIIVASKAGYVKIIKSKTVVTAGLWIIFAYLLLNTLGNLTSPVAAEMWLFAPLSLVMALLALRLAVEK